MRSKFALLSSFNRISAASSEEPTNPLAQKTKVTCAVQILFLWISISFNKPTLAGPNGLRSTCNISVDARTCRTTPQRVEWLTMRTKQGINRGQELDETSRISSFVSGCDVVGGKNYLHHSTNYFYPENDVWDRPSEKFVRTSEAKFLFE